MNSDSYSDNNSNNTQVGRLINPPIDPLLAPIDPLLVQQYRETKILVDSLEGQIENLKSQLKSANEKLARIQFEIDMS